MKETKNATIRLDMPMYEYLSSFGSITQGIVTVATKLQQLEKISENELRGKFTKNEWYELREAIGREIADASQRYLVEPLIYKIKDRFHYSNNDVLIEKVKTLSAAQIDAVYKRVENYYKFNLVSQVWENF